MSTDQRLEVLGYPRSGTGYLAKLVRNNLPDVEVVDRHKHNPRLGAPDDLPAVAIVKEPFAWLLSYQRFIESRPVVHRTFSAWRRARGVAVQPWLAELWFHGYAAAYAHWTTCARPTRLVAYRDLLLDPAGEIADVAAFAGVEPAEPFRDVEGRVTPEGEELETTFDPTLYTEWRYLDEYPRDNVAEIIETLERTGLDEDIRLASGYDVHEVAKLVDDPGAREGASLFVRPGDQSTSERTHP